MAVKCPEQILAGQRGNSRHDGGIGWKKKKAIEIFNKWMDCKDAYQAVPSCDGRCHSCEYITSAEEEKEAMQMAISALEKQEQTKEAIPHRNYQYLSDYWCECGCHLRKDQYGVWVKDMNIYPDE